MRKILNVQGIRGDLLESSIILRKRIAVVKESLSALRADKKLCIYEHANWRLNRRKVEELAVCLYDHKEFESMLMYIQTGMIKVKRHDLKELMQYFNEMEIERHLCMH